MIDILEDTPLYRYISFETFTDIVLSKSLSFVHPLKAWEDTYEGYIYRALQNDTGIEKMSEIISELNTEQTVKEDFPQIVLEMSRNRFWCICWSQEKDSVPLWSIYSYYNKAVMIKTVASDLLHKLNRQVSLCPVKYYDVLNLKAEIEKLFEFKHHPKDTLPFKPIDALLSKRKAFEHEKEIRCFYDASLLETEYEKLPIAIPVSIKCHISELIHDVQVHPLAPDWYANTVKMFCDSYGIKFSGKSKLYDLVFD